MNDHEYVIYDPRDDSEEDWDYWNLICRVIFSIALLCPYLWLVLYINNFGWAGFFPSPNWWSFWMQNLYNVVLHQSQILSFKKYNKNYPDILAPDLLWRIIRRSWQVGCSWVAHRARLLDWVHQRRVWRSRCTQVLSMERVFRNCSNVFFVEWWIFCLLGILPWISIPNYQQVRDWAERKNDPEQRNLQMARCWHKCRLWCCHPHVDKLVSFGLEAKDYLAISF